MRIEDFEFCGFRVLRILSIAVYELAVLEYRVVCRNFGHPTLTPSFTKYTFFQIKNSFATLVNELSVLKLFQLSNGDLFFRSMTTACTKRVNLE